MRIDTNGSKGQKPGTYTFLISAYPHEVKTSNFTKFEFMFSAEGEKEIKIQYFPNQMKELLAALGFPEVEPGVFDGDITDAYGKSVIAELFYEEYTKKDGTKGNARRLRNFKSCEMPDVVTFGDEGHPETPADIAWQEN